MQQIILLSTKCRAAGEHLKRYLERKKKLYGFTIRYNILYKSNCALLKANMLVIYSDCHNHKQQSRPCGEPFTYWKVMFRATLVTKTNRCMYKTATYQIRPKKLHVRHVNVKVIVFGMKERGKQRDASNLFKTAFCYYKLTFKK